VSRRAGIRKHMSGLLSISQVVSTRGYFVASLFESALEYATVKVQENVEGLNQAPAYANGVTFLRREYRFQRMEQKRDYRIIKKVE
jgi:hypothetical protein